LQILILSNDVDVLMIAFFLNNLYNILEFFLLKNLYRRLFLSSLSPIDFFLINLRMA